MGEPVHIRDVVGGGYDEFWTCRKPYRIVKGSKGSKKSKTAALWYIFNMMKMPDSNLLVVRRYGNSLKDSCYADLLWAVNRLGVSDYWERTKSPLQLTYKPTGQVVLFKGLDDSEKIGSISVPKGYLCWVWIEEFYEITDPLEFDKLDASIRGALPPESGLFKQITATFNPWSEHTWIKARFFDEPDDLTFTMTTTYRINEWFDEADRRKYEAIRERDPRNAKVICDGDWGVSEGLVYSNWTVEDFDKDDVKARTDLVHTVGLDFGFATSYNALVASSIDMKGYTIWVYDELYERGQSTLDLLKAIASLGYAKEVIWADSAAPLSIHEMRNGLKEEVWTDAGPEIVTWSTPSIRPAVKGPDSVLNGIKKLQGFHVVIHPSCSNFIKEISSYAFEVKDGQPTNRPIKEFDHCLDAWRYSVSPLVTSGRGGVFVAGSDEDIDKAERTFTRVGVAGCDEDINRKDIGKDEGEGTWRVFSV